MITISGREIVPGGYDAPSLYDIGYSLSRVPRFGGHTTLPWSVLQHLLACSAYAAARGYGATTALYALLHDAHEAVISDIPRPWKTEDMRMHQHELDVRLYHSLGISVPDLFTERLVKGADEIVALAEAAVLGPPGSVKAVGGGNPPNEQAKALVSTIGMLTGHLSSIEMAVDFESKVQDFLKEYHVRRRPQAISPAQG